MKTNQLTNEITTIVYESYFDWRTGEADQVTVLGKCSSKDRRYQDMMENLRFTVVKFTNLPDGYKCMIRFTDPIDDDLGQSINPRTEIYALCNWVAKEITNDWHLP